MWLLGLGSWGDPVMRNGSVVFPRCTPSSALGKCISFLRWGAMVSAKMVEWDSRAHSVSHLKLFASGPL